MCGDVNVYGVMADILLACDAPTESKYSHLSSPRAPSDIVQVAMTALQVSSLRWFFQLQSQLTSPANRKPRLAARIWQHRPVIPLDQMLVDVGHVIQH